MKQEIAHTETVERTREVTVCDRCGLEAGEGRVTYYRDASVELTDRTRRDLQAYRSARERPVVTELELKSSMELDHSGTVDLCEECDETVFGWPSVPE